VELEVLEDWVRQRQDGVALRGRTRVRRATDRGSSALQGLMLAAQDRLSALPDAVAAAPAVDQLVFGLPDGSTALADLAGHFTLRLCATLYAAAAAATATAARTALHWLTLGCRPPPPPPPPPPGGLLAGGCTWRRSCFGACWRSSRGADRAHTRTGCGWPPAVAPKCTRLCGAGRRSPRSARCQARRAGGCVGWGGGVP
jgi:hypothetical protein